MAFWYDEEDRAFINTVKYQPRPLMKESRFQKLAKQTRLRIGTQRICRHDKDTGEITIRHKFKSKPVQINKDFKQKKCNRVKAKINQNNIVIITPFKHDWNSASHEFDGDNQTSRLLSKQSSKQAYRPRTAGLTQTPMSRGLTPLKSGRKIKSAYSHTRPSLNNRRSKLSNNNNSQLRYSNSSINNDSITSDATTYTDLENEKDKTTTCTTFLESMNEEMTKLQGKFHENIKRPFSSPWAVVRMARANMDLGAITSKSTNIDDDSDSVSSSQRNILPKLKNRSAHGGSNSATNRSYASVETTDTEFISKTQYFDYMKHLSSQMNIELLNPENQEFLLDLFRLQQKQYKRTESKRILKTNRRRREISMAILSKLDLDLNYLDFKHSYAKEGFGQYRKTL